MKLHVTYTPRAADLKRTKSQTPYTKGLCKIMLKIKMPKEEKQKREKQNPRTLN